jgi:hypothetical protein
MLGMILSIVVVVGMTALYPVVTVHATSTFEDLGRDIDRAGDNYQAGQRDGEEAGENDYPNRDSSCPGEPLSAYCIGYGLGYGRGWNAAKTLAD